MSATRSPALARAVLSALALRGDRASLIGDLEEEFVTRAARSQGEAMRWYRRQAWASVPSLARRRLTGPGARQVALVVALTVFAYVAIAAWEITIARPMAKEFSLAFQDAPRVLSRGFFIGAQMAGVAIAGAVVAALTFRPAVGFWSNFMRRVAPLGVALIAPVLVVMTLASDTYPIAFRLAWAAAAAPSLIAGAWLGGRLRSRPKT